MKDISVFIPAEALASIPDVIKVFDFVIRKTRLNPNIMFSVQPAPIHGYESKRAFYGPAEELFQYMHQISDAESEKWRSNWGFIIESYDPTYLDPRCDGCRDFCPGDGCDCLEGWGLITKTFPWELK